MDRIDAVLLTSWNCVTGPQIECLWLPFFNPEFHLSEVSKDFLSEYNVLKDIVSSEINNESALHSPKNECNVYMKFEDFKTEIHNAGAKKYAAASHADDLIKSFYSDIEKMRIMSGLMLVCEVDAAKPFSENVSRLFCLENKMLVSVIFHKFCWTDSVAMQTTEDICYCLGILVKHDATSFTFNIIHTIDLYLRNAVCVIQKAMGSPSLVAKEVSSVMENLHEILRNTTTESKLHFKSPLWLSFQSPQQQKFLSRAITSHIQTSGCSLVVGNSKFHVNMMLYILMLFNSEKDKLCSQIVTEELSKTNFKMGLQVQGLLKDANLYNEQMLPDFSTFLNSITIIDMDWCKVRQKIWNSSDDSNKNSLKTVTESGKLVTQLIQDLIFCEKHSANTSNLVVSFCELLHVKAVSLIKMIEEFRFLNKLPGEKEFMHKVHIADMEDLQLLLGYAEKVKPGIRTAFAYSS